MKMSSNSRPVLRPVASMLLTASFAFGIAGTAAAQQNTPQGMPQNTPQSMPQNMPQSMPQSTQQTMPQNTQQTMPQSMPQNTQQTMPQSMPQNTQQTMPQNTQQNMQRNTAGGTVGGTSTDNTSAGNANGTGMPQTQRQGSVSFVSGGVGLDESRALINAARQWPLSLRFTAASGEYLADVHVTITDAHGASVLDTTSRGPYMLVKVPPGRYSVSVSHAGIAKKSAVRVAANGTARATFTW